MNDLAALISPAAEPFLEEMAHKAHELTLRRFGRVIQMYAPLYLGNECMNACVYCGFSRKNKVKRCTLSQEEALKDAEVLLKDGFKHILLVSGESPKHVNAKTIGDLVACFNGKFASVSIEVQPMTTDDYSYLISKGVDSLVSYQETYNPDAYPKFHPKGPKADFTFRLETAERGGDAGFRKIGIGALLGLSDWRTEGFFLGLHAGFLQKKYWRSQVTISFPRLRPCAGGYPPPFLINDTAFVQLLCALRIVHADAGLVVSTREGAEFREKLVPLGVTQMSAGSRTEPGGYSNEGAAERQFEIDDSRSPREVAKQLLKLGYEPVWKDWDATFLTPSTEIVEKL